MALIEIQENVKIKDKFSDFIPFLIGNPRQFIWDKGKVICLRDKQTPEEKTPCDSCPHNTSCKHTKTKIYNAPIPHARRMTGMEETPFFILKFNQGHSYDTLPDYLWNQKYDKECFNYCNNHFLYNDNTKPYRVIKGQIRWYGTEQEFLQSEYSNYFHILSHYEPLHYQIANDVKSQEPLFSTIVTRCKPWVESFEGTPKPVARLVKGIVPPEPDNMWQFIKAAPKDQPKDGSYTSYWCCLTGELDKNDFNIQCAKCPQVEKCELIRSYKHNVPGDWHKSNAFAFMPVEYKKYHTLAPKAIYQIRKVNLKGADISKFAFIHKVDEHNLCFSEECTISCPLKSSCTIEAKYDYHQKYTETHVQYVRENSDEELQIPIEHFPDKIEVCSDPKKFKNEVRAIAKILGLAVTYGAGSYTIARNIHDSEEKAQELLDNFFKRLPEVMIHIESTKQRVAQTSQALNIFGRIWDLHYLTTWNPALSKSDNFKNKGKAERTALNHPIQSSAAEAMKLAFSRVSEFVYSHHLSPLWGNAIPQKNDFTYKDIIYHPCGMIHDEIDFLVHKKHMDEVVPPIYEVISLKDVFKALGFKFNFEMDLEFDLTYSFTSTSRYPTSRSYVLSTQYNDSITTKPNTIFVNMNLLTKEMLNYLSQVALTPRNDPNHTYYSFSIMKEGQVFSHKSKFTEDEIKELGIEYSLAYVAPIGAKQ